MEKNIDVQNIEAAFNNVLNKKVFKKSSLQERILRYLIDEAIAGNDVKEQSIGIELFKDKYDPDQNDSKVRVYVYYLRKKLDEYYKGDGKNESIRFTIEKGQYNLSFHNNSEDTSKRIFSHRGLTIHISMPIIFIAGAILLLALGLSTWQSLKSEYIWNPFFNGQKLSLCIIADHFMVKDMTHSEMLGFSTFRDIQNEEELTNYIKENPDKNFQSGGFTMTTKMASFGVHLLNQWFCSNKHQFDIQLESETPLLDYINNNVIYIGQSKTMQASQSIFLSKSKVFKVQNDGFLFKNDNEEKHYNTLFKKYINQEYAMVSFQKLDNGNYTLFFVSNHDIGVIATIKMFTNEQKLKSFYKHLPNNDAEFNALFKVSGMERTDLSCELVEIEIL